MTGAKRLHNVRLIQQTTNNYYFGPLFPLSLSSYSLDICSGEGEWTIDGYRDSIFRMNMEWSVGVETEMQ